MLIDDVLHFPTNAAIKCRLLLTPGEGTSYGSVSRNVFLPGETLRVICGEKYGISNNQESAVTTCNEDGEWTIRPVCTGTTIDRLILLFSTVCVWFINL